jgi:hypothetical protein
MTNQTSFAILPEQNDLSSIPRELSFHPSTTKNPGMLTREQIEAFNHEGYLKGIRIFDQEEIEEHRTYFDKLLATIMAQGGDSYSISTAHLKYGEVYDLLTHPRIVAHVKDLIGEDVIGWGSHYFCKMPHDDKTVTWRQDAAYWPLTPSKTVTVWLAIDDADLENACVRFVAGSHRFGLITHLPSEASENNILNQTVDDHQRYGRLVEVVLKAGEISIHSDLLLHGSKANNSDRRRCGLTLRYCTPDVRAYLDWHKKGVVVSGEDPEFHWANPARP